MSSVFSLLSLIISRTTKPYRTVIDHLLKGHYLICHFYILVYFLITYERLHQSLFLKGMQEKNLKKNNFIGLKFTCYCLKDEVLSRGNVSRSKKCLHSKNDSQNSYNCRECFILADKAIQYFPNGFTPYPEHCQY